MQIYKITNLITGLSYIGKDQNDNPYYMGSGILLWNSYRKRFERDDLDEDKKSHHKWVYNENLKLQYYTKEVLEMCDDANKLCELEKYYIKKYDTIRPNGYNIADGGEGGNLIAGYTEEERELHYRKISEKTKEAMQRPDVRKNFMSSIQNRGEEWKKRISESLTGKPGHKMTDEQKENLRQINLGNQYGVGNKSRTGQKDSEETRRKKSEASKKVEHTSEWNAKVGAALNGKPKTEEHKATLRKPKPKYKWLLPDGSIKIMDASNGAKHKDWTRLEQVF